MCGFTFCLRLAPYKERLSKGIPDLCRSNLPVNEKSFSARGFTRKEYRVYPNERSHPPERSPTCRAKD